MLAASLFPATTMSPPSIKVLIVDDAKAMRTVLAALLAKNGYQVVGELEDGLRVAERVGQLQPDLVCLDFHMPGCDGLTVLKALQERYPEVAVVMLTGETSPTLRAAAAEAGAAGFLQKPFSPQQILSELRNVAAALQLLRNRAHDEVPDLVVGQPRVVIADDSTTLRRLLRVILEGSGLQVLAEACDGRQAVDLVRQHRPDLLCLDVEMPVLDGIAALSRIRAIAPELPVMMITSHADRDTVQRAAQQGARGYIVKPYQPDKVAEAIRRLLKLG
jgi:two-component system chemotaxis response regulator CheY